MNDPHVVSLTYRIEKAETVDFDKAPPLTVDRGSFRVTIDAYRAKVELVDHFASVKEARERIDPFLRAWELEADLRDTGGSRFVYETAEVIDRSPPAGGTAVALGAGTIAVAGARASVRVGRAKWPDPPRGLELSPDVDALWRRWRRYREEKREPLLSAAYWALTMLEAAPGLSAAPAGPRRSSNRRQAAGAFFNIDLGVLNKIGELTSSRGGNDEERKAEGRATPLSRAERQWLEATFRAIVRRVAEQAYHGGPPPRPLTMGDLPTLTP